MALTLTDPDRLDTPAALRVEQVPVAEEMNESFMAYAMSVITSRAIPDARDGLKPVQRRVLWAMSRMGIRPSGPYRKSARVVGDTMGRYHPHGDAAIYDALVRLAQDFSLVLPLVAPQGNFGSLDDPPAASRYTECRLAEAAMLMLSEADEDTVDWQDTYDGEGQEPVVLPSQFPNLLVNGSSGIAVGMTTKIWSHNLSEVAACVRLISEKRMATRAGAHPKISVDELLKKMPGPDFPAGGVLIQTPELREAYETGRGSVTLIARIKAERSTRTRLALTITELPYLVGPEQVVARVQKLLTENKLDGVASIADLSDTSGVRLRVELKPGANPQKVVDALYQQTPLQSTLKANFLALVGGMPVTLTLRQMLDEFVDHRLDVVKRRTNHRIKKAEARLHLVDGLIVAVDAIDTVVSIVRKAKTPETAGVNLRKKLKLTILQSDQVLNMPIRRLTSLEQARLKEEASTLRRNIKEWKALLGSHKKQLETVRDETLAASSKLSQPRQTQIAKTEKAAVSLEISDTETAATQEVSGPCQVTLSTSGQIGVENAATGKRTVFGRHDLVAAQTATVAGAEISAVTSTGRTYVVPVNELSNAGGRGRGDVAKDVFGLSRNEELAGMIGSQGVPAAVFSSNGKAKRLEGSEMFSKSSQSVIKLDKNVVVVGAVSAQPQMLIVWVTSKGRVGVIDAGDLPIHKRQSQGVAAMKLDKAETIVAVDILTSATDVAYLTNKNRWARIPVGELRPARRPTNGKQVASLDDKEQIVQAQFMPDTTVLACLVADKERRDGTNPTPVVLESEAGSTTEHPLTHEQKIIVLASGRTL